MTEKKTFDVRGACASILVEQNRLERAEASASKALAASQDALGEILSAVREYVEADGSISKDRMVSILNKHKRGDQ